MDSEIGREVNAARGWVGWVGVVGWLVGCLCVEQGLMMGWGVGAFG